MANDTMTKEDSTALGPGFEACPPNFGQSVRQSTGRNAQLLGAASPPARTQVSRGFGPGGELKNEALVQQAARNHPTALEDEFGLGAEDVRADLQHPFGRRQADGCTPCLTKDAHELGVRQWVGRGEIHGAVKLLALDKPVNGTDEIVTMNPGDILASIAGPATQAAAHQRKKHIKDAA